MTRIVDMLGKLRALGPLEFGRRLGHRIYVLTLRHLMPVVEPAVYDGVKVGVDRRLFDATLDTVLGSTFAS